MGFGVSFLDGIKDISACLKILRSTPQTVVLLLLYVSSYSSKRYVGGGWRKIPRMKIGISNRNKGKIRRGEDVTATA